jgi:hypothetical protein
MSCEHDADFGVILRILIEAAARDLLEIDLRAAAIKWQPLFKGG